MIGRRTTAGLTLLCALVSCAFAAQSASAQKGTPATNTTAFTCVNVGANKGEFSDEHCDTKVGPEKGSFAHQEFPKSKETTAIEVTNEKTSDDTTKATTAVLTSVHLGVHVEITCTVVKEKAGGKNWIQNVEKEGKHTVEGTVEAEFTKCTVVKPAKCEIAEPIKSIAKFIGVEGLKGGGKEKTMGIEFAQDEGKPFAEITFKNKGVEACAFNGKTFNVAGSAIATGKPEPSATNKHSGATSIFQRNETVETGKDNKPAEEMETLTFGGSRSHFDARFTTRMAEKGNPITTTTVT